jgi:hypothetical protein
MTFVRRYGVELLIVGSLLLAVAYFAYLAFGLLPRNIVDEDFSGSRAFDDVTQQLSYGSRATGSPGSKAQEEWLVQQLTGLGWDVVIQEFPTAGGVKARNVVAIQSPDDLSSPPVAMLATHRDSRLVADGDADPSNQNQPAPGANNGASGTAVLLELARTLNVQSSRHTVCLAFLDAEANAEIPGWSGWAGSMQLAATLDPDILRCAAPRFVAALDQVGATEARFAMEASSDPALTAAVWGAAQRPGVDDAWTIEPVPARRNSHTAFAQAGYPATLVADIDDTTARTMGDTVTRMSKETLQSVGRTLEEWIEAGAQF